MSRIAPLEVCARCEMFKPSSEMTNVYARDDNGKVVSLRLCRTCANPNLTYIQAAWFQGLSLDRSVTVAAIMTAVLVTAMVLFGAIIGPTLGWTLMFTGILTGSCVLVALAVASCIPHSS